MGVHCINVMNDTITDSEEAQTEEKSTKEKMIEDEINNIYDKNVQIFEKINLSDKFVSFEETTNDFGQPILAVEFEEETEEDIQTLDEEFIICEKTEIENGNIQIEVRYR